MIVGKSIADVVSGYGIGSAGLKKNVLAIGTGQVFSSGVAYAVNMIRSKF